MIRGFEKCKWYFPTEMRNNNSSNSNINSNNINSNSSNNMESYYEDNQQFPGQQSSNNSNNGNNLKRPATLELKQPLRKQKFNSSVTGTVLNSPDFQLLKFASPELEKIMTGQLQIPTPTPSILYPQKVSRDITYKLFCGSHSYDLNIQYSGDHRTGGICQRF